VSPPGHAGTLVLSLGSKCPSRCLQGSKGPPVCFASSDGLQLRVCPLLYHLPGARDGSELQRDSSPSGLETSHSSCCQWGFFHQNLTWFDCTQPSLSNPPTTGLGQSRPLPAVRGPRFLQTKANLRGHLPPSWCHEDALEKGALGSRDG